MLLATITKCSKAIYCSIDRDSMPESVPGDTWRRVMTLPTDFFQDSLQILEQCQGALKHITQYQLRKLFQCQSASPRLQQALTKLSLCHVQCWNSCAQITESSADWDSLTFSDESLGSGGAGGLLWKPVLARRKFSAS